MVRQKKQSKIIKLDDGTNITILDDMNIGKHGKYNKRLLFPNDVFDDDELLCVLSNNDFQKLIQHNTSDTIQEQTSTINELYDKIESLEQDLDEQVKQNHQLQQECDKHKETIKNQEHDIHEKEQTIQSLSQLNDNIPVKQHYQEIQELNNKLNYAQLQETKKISKINSQHKNEIHDIKDKFNVLATKYNDLCDDVASISLIDVFLRKHKKKVANNEPIQLFKINDDTYVVPTQQRKELMEHEDSM